jgi:hypothetical protein
MSSEGENTKAKPELAEGLNNHIDYSIKNNCKTYSEHSDCGLLGCETIQLCT